MVYANTDAALSAAVKLLVRIKHAALQARLREPKDGLVTPMGKCLVGVEGDVEKWLNELALDHPELAEGWRMTPEFASDHT